MTFTIIPAVDLKNGKVTRLIQGDPTKTTIEISNPLNVAKRWESLGTKRLHLVDLDGALGGVRKNEKIVREIIENLDIPLQFGGGIRTPEDAARFLDFGAAKVIIGTMALENPGVLKDLSLEYGKERLIVALDSKAGNIVTKGWVKDTGEQAVDVVKKFEEHASECLYTNVDVEGMVEGLDIDKIRDVVESTTMSVIASGGVSSLDDIKAVKNAGAGSVVIGTALYTERIDFKETLKLEEG